MMHFFKAFHDAESIARYYFAFSVAFCLAATLRVLADDLAWPPRKAVVAAIGMVAVGVGYQFLNEKDTVLRHGVGDVTAFNDLVRSRGRFIPNAPPTTIRRLQATVPPGQPILVMLDHATCWTVSGTPSSITITRGPWALAAAPRRSRARKRWPRTCNHGVRYIAFRWALHRASTTGVLGRRSPARSS